MLRLNRNKGESLIIQVDGRIIEVQVLSSGPQVKLGVIADKDISVDRLEVYQQKLNNQK